MLSGKELLPFAASTRCLHSQIQTFSHHLIHHHHFSVYNPLLQPFSPFLFLHTTTYTIILPCLEDRRLGRRTLSTIS
jgi:hypothetical protein